MMRHVATQVFGRKVARALGTTSWTGGHLGEAVVTIWPAWTNLHGGESLDVTWPYLFEVLRRWRPFRGQLYHPGWTAATFAPMARTSANVRSVSALVMHFERVPALTVKDLAAAWGAFYGLVQTTNRHSRTALDALVILPYARAASLAEHRRVAVWSSLRNLARGIPPDPGARSPARWLYLPGTVPGYTFETCELAGPYLDPGGAAAEGCWRTASIRRRFLRVQ
jgi:hypothetical protein